jgi:tetratricopeptide (TPR) repeat protein
LCLLFSSEPLEVPPLDPADEIVVFLKGNLQDPALPDTVLTQQLEGKIRKAPQIGYLAVTFGWDVVEGRFSYTLSKETMKGLMDALRLFLGETSWGVSIEFVRNFMLLCRAYQDDGHIVTNFHDARPLVEMLTAKYRFSLVDHNLRADPQPSMYIGKPTVFVSHSWGDRLDDVFDVLERFAKDQKDEKKVFFWFDLFCVNQHQMTEMEAVGEDWWFDLPQIDATKNLLLVLSPWMGPSALKRKWCIWEIFYASKLCQDVAFHVDFPSRQKALMEAEANRSHELFYDALFAIDVAKAGAFNPGDVKKIDERISSAGSSHHEVNKHVKDVLRKQFIEFINKRLETATPDSDEEFNIVNYYCGTALQKFGMHKNAENILFNLLKRRRARLALLPDSYERKIHVIKTLTNLGNVYYSLGKFPLALETFDEALDIGRRARVGMEELLPSQISRIDPLIELRRYDEATDEGKALLARSDISVADRALILSNIAFSFINREKFEDAKVFCDQALETCDSQQRPCSNMRMTEAHVRSNLCIIYLKLGGPNLDLELKRNNLDLALQHINAALAIFETLPGSDNLETAKANRLKGEVLLDFFLISPQNNALLEQAEQLFYRSSSLYQAIVGSQHNGFVELLVSFGRLHLSKTEYSQAQRHLVRAHVIQESLSHGMMHINCAKILFALGSLHSDQGKLQSARTLVQRAYNLSLMVGGENHSLTIACNIFWVEHLA